MAGGYKNERFNPVNPVYAGANENVAVRGGAGALMVGSICGIASGGSNTTIVDALKNLEADALNGKPVIVRISGIDYLRVITDTAGSTLTVPGFNTPVAAVAAECAIANGENGAVTITSLVEGTGPNAYVVILSDGTEDGELSGVFAAGVLQITSAYAESAAVAITAAALAALINTDPALSLLFSAEVDNAGDMATGATEHEFSGGVDEVPAIVCAAGCEYVVIL